MKPIYLRDLLLVNTALEYFIFQFAETFSTIKAA